MSNVIRKILCLVVCLLSASTMLLAANTDTQEVMLRVDRAVIAVFDEDYVTLTLGTPIPGGLPPDGTLEVTYGFFANFEDFKMTVGVTGFPADSALELTVNVEPPTGSTGAGDIVFTSSTGSWPATRIDCITNVVMANQSGLKVNYTLHCNSIPQGLWGGSLIVYLESIAE